MKTLFLVRHAKSSWDDPSLDDRERPLAERGWRDLAKMARRLARREVLPDLILSSPALRARTTAEAMARALGYRRGDIRLEEQLYACPADDLLAVIHGLDDGCKRVMLVGHNPELAELARRLAEEIARLPTCAVAELRFDTDTWLDVGHCKLAKVRLDYPKKGRE